MKFKILQDKNIKIVRSEKYNYNYDKKTGFFARWGENKEDDPPFAPGPEILDIEISSGKCSGNCKFCYKENSAEKEAENMTLEQYKTILDKMPKFLTQVAFGICDIDTNPDFFPMMEYTREKGYCPNFTCNGYQVTDEIAERVAGLCGAVAVSVYDKESSYDAIEKFTRAGMNEVNIHFMLSEETYDRAVSIVHDIANDPRLEKLNAIVFLAYKPKGNNKGTFTTIKDIDRYKSLMKVCEEYNIDYGMDSCSAGMYLSAIQDREDRIELSKYVESCESSMFSGYINSKGIYYHCSFSEGEGAWKDGIDVLNCDDFTKDVWLNELTEKFRRGSVKSNDSNPYKDCGECRSCLVFPEINPW